MKRIIIIVPYFGPFPVQFKFWLQSAYDNPTVDFLLITDQVLVSRDNVKVVSMTFSELKTFIQAKFNFLLSIKSPYKLCDFKPAYGYIFQQYINDYDFWGFGDVDLVYGSIRSFYTDEILSKYKLISGFGHLSLYENSDFCRNFYKTDCSGFQFYRDSFSNPNNTVFDEYLHGGMSDLWKHLHPNSIYDQRSFDDILVPRLSFNFISVFNSKVSNNLIFEYLDGKLFRIFMNENHEIIREPTLYAHFQQRKFMKVKTDNLDHYLIIPNSFIDFSKVTNQLLNKYGKSQNRKRILWNILNRLNRRLNIILPFLFYKNK